APVPLMLLPAPPIACVPPENASVPGEVAVNEPLCVPLPASATVTLVTLTVPLLLRAALIVLLAVPLSVPAFAIVPEPPTLALTLSVPSFCSVRPSVTGALTASAACLVVIPVPLIVPPDQVPPFVSVTGPLPLSVPALIVSVPAVVVAPLNT